MRFNTQKYRQLELLRQNLGRQADFIWFPEVRAKCFRSVNTESG